MLASCSRIWDDESEGSAKKEKKEPEGSASFVAHPAAQAASRRNVAVRIQPSSGTQRRRREAASPKVARWITRAFIAGRAGASDKATPESKYAPCCL